MSETRRDRVGIDCMIAFSGRKLRVFDVFQVSESAIQEARYDEASGCVDLEVGRRAET